MSGSKKMVENLLVIDEKAGHLYEEMYEKFRSKLDEKITESRKNMVNKEWKKKMNELPKHDGKIESFILFNKRIGRIMNENICSDGEKLSILGKMIFADDELMVKTCKNWEEARKNLVEK